MSSNFLFSPVCSPGVLILSVTSMHNVFHNVEHHSIQESCLNTKCVSCSKLCGLIFTYHFRVSSVIQYNVMSQMVVTVKFLVSLRC